MYQDFLFTKINKDMQSESFSIEIFIVAVKEEGNFWESGEWIKGNQVHYGIYVLFYRQKR